MAGVGGALLLDSVLDGFSHHSPGGFGQFGPDGGGFGGGGFGSGGFDGGGFGG